jgi:hypothetical protein
MEAKKHFHRHPKQHEDGKDDRLLDFDFDVLLLKIKKKASTLADAFNTLSFQ